MDSKMSLKSNMSNKQQLLMQSLTHFFTRKENIDEFLSVTQSGAPISLRVIDWFVTNYSRDNDVSYGHPKTPSPFLVHDSYKSQLKAYSKRQFDPFCRRMRINFYYKPGQKVVTTVGQLNFFRWSLENGVIAYIRKHFKSIEQHMKKYVKTHRDAKRVRNKSPTMSPLLEDGDMIGGSGKGSGGANKGESSSGASSKTKRKAMVSVAGRRSISKHNVQMTVYFQ